MQEGSGKAKSDQSTLFLTKNNDLLSMAKKSWYTAGSSTVDLTTRMGEGSSLSSAEARFDEMA